jgi:hypothetical protein
MRPGQRKNPRRVENGGLERSPGIPHDAQALKESCDGHIVIAGTLQARGRACEVRLRRHILNAAAAVKAARQHLPGTQDA